MWLSTLDTRRTQLPLWGDVSGVLCMVASRVPPRHQSWLLLDRHGGVPRVERQIGARGPHGHADSWEECGCVPV